jgi:hypothetical protein
MKKLKLTQSKTSGQGLVLVIIVLVIILGIVWYLYSTKASSQRDAIRYGHEVIDRLVLKHDRSILDQDLSSQAKLEMPPSQREYLIQRLGQFGSPAQPIQIDDSVTFDSYFFHPYGIFTAHLNFPGQPITLQIAISQGTTKWLIENVTLSTQGAQQ